jgi:hypothetical protein
MKTGLLLNDNEVSATFSFCFIVNQNHCWICLKDLGICLFLIYVAHRFMSICDRIHLFDLLDMWHLASCFSGIM